MKIEKEGFVPVVITLETQEELNGLYNVVGNSYSNAPMLDKLYNALDQMGAE